MIPPEIYWKCLDDYITAGMIGAIADYTNPDEKHMLDGSLAGFNACRNKTFEELYEVASEVASYMMDAYYRDNKDVYQFYLCYHAEVNFVIGRMKVLDYLFQDPPSNYDISSTTCLCIF